MINVSSKAMGYYTHFRPLGYSLLRKPLHLAVFSSLRRSFTISAQFQDEARILEVGPRDGLQNMKQIISTSLKVELINRLAAAGLKNIEATSFVSPKWVPQLADGAEVMSQILPAVLEGRVRFPVLAPNPKGLENALKSRAKEVVIFASATEAFSKANQNCTVDEALAKAQQVAESALKQNVLVRGVVSCIFSDPYSGPTDPQQVKYVVKRLLDMGCYEVGLGDTLGVGTPKDVQILLEVLLAEIPASKLAGHYHDTYGQAVANVVKSYDMGLRTFDSSVAGLGGCPYAVGAKGNLATEDIAYTFEKMGINTGIDLNKLVSTGEWISHQLGIPYGSRVGSALAAKKNSPLTAPKPPSSLSRTTLVSPISTNTASSRSWKTIEDNGEYIVTRAGNAIKITLNRPRNGNALTGSMVEGLTKLFRSLASDASVFHVVLAAEGKFFCTGMDMSGGTSISDMSDVQKSYYSKVAGLFIAIDKAPQTTIAMIDGPCYAGGVGLAFVCDIRIVSSRARWTLSEIKLGLTPAIISKYMIREWGMPFSREAILSGREIKPEELLRIGAIHGIAEDKDALNQQVEAYLDNLSKCAPRSGANVKELYQLGWTDPGGEAQDAKIQKTFEEMMAPGSEGKYGIEQFQKKVKGIDWGQFWESRSKL